MGLGWGESQEKRQQQQQRQLVSRIAESYRFLCASVTLKFAQKRKGQIAVASSGYVTQLVSGKRSPQTFPKLPLSWISLMDPTSSSRCFLAASPGRGRAVPLGHPGHVVPQLIANREGWLSVLLLSSTEFRPFCPRRSQRSQSAPLISSIFFTGLKRWHTSGHQLSSGKWLKIMEQKARSGIIEV